MDVKPTDPLRHHILEAVDCLRQRKCRPDRESIAHYVLRKFGSTMNEIFAELENIVDEGGLIKVEYKGTTSYRSPSNFDTKNSPLLTKHSKILNSSKTTRLIITGINELLAKDPIFTKEGVPLYELKQVLLGYDADRFSEDKIDVLLERETNCGSIFIAKSSILQHFLRVFPKDIPVPSDMRVISLSTDNSTGEKEEKKPRKPRKSASATPEAAAGSSGVKKGGRVKVKKEPEPVVEEDLDNVDISANAEETVIATKSKPVIVKTEQTEEAPKEPTLKKNARLTPAKRKLVPEQVAETVRKSYEETPEFETTSAQMIKLAESVVSKQSEEAPKPKGPMLVLAGSISLKSGNGELTEDVPNISSETKSPSKDEPMEIDTNIVKVETTKATPTGGKRRGRPPANKEKEKVVVENAKKEEEPKQEEEEATTTTESSPANEGLTRSKRDKRKRQVFDPSDLPNTYTTYSTSSKATTRKSRSNRSPSPEEPPPKKAIVTRQEKASPKKSLPSAAVNEVDSVNKTKKSTPEKPTNKKGNSSSLKNATNDSASEPDKVELPLEELAAAAKDASGNEEIKNGDLKNVKKESAPVSNSPAKPNTKEKGSCEYCQEKSKKTDDGADEEFLTCASCQANIHPSCMDYPPELAKRIKEFNMGKGDRLIQWQCFDCKTCGVCNQRMMHGSDNIPPGLEKPIPSGKADGLLQFILCENCDVGFHAKCVSDFPKKAGGVNWVCRECKESRNNETPKVAAVAVAVEDEESKNKASVSGKKKGRRPSRRQSKVIVKQEVDQDDSTISMSDLVDVKLEVGNEKVDLGMGGRDVGSSDIDSEEEDQDQEDPEKIDITAWTTSDVEAYFTEKGLKEEAQILKNQEVDGYSLLLLQREDIVKGMGFRLGPALKVNRIIFELQAKAPVRAKWNDEVPPEVENGIENSASAIKKN